MVGWLGRLPRAGCGLVAGGLLWIPTGQGSTTAAITERLNALSARPLPTVSTTAPSRSDMVWVPDRYVPVPGAPERVLVPGHWERQLSDREVYVPPLVIVHPRGGPELIPAGVRQPADSRLGP